MLWTMLAIASLLLISLGVYFLAQRTRIPYTILLVVAGLVLIPISRIEPFQFIQSIKLTPDLLFYVILPILIFESAFNINLKKMLESIRSISLLSILSLLISTAFITVVLHYGSVMIGVPLPFELTLLFGALISATDPVAVLALFKEYGAPKRLSLIFEGESLFNDGTSLALFLIVLGVLTSGWHGAASIGEGFFMFVSMVIGGIVFGGIMGAIFSKLIEKVRNNHYVEITLTMIVAHFTFIFSEIVSHGLSLLGHEIRLSSIIATVVAAMVVGNYGRYKISPRVGEYMDVFWGYFAFIANSIVFILIGLLFASIDVSLIDLIAPVILAIVVVMIGRALSVYPVIGLLNMTKKEEHIPRSWQHLLAWGSLRGALAVTMVLLIPDNFSIPNWPYENISPKDYITAFTIACIYFTLFIKASTIGPLIKKLKINALSKIEEVEYEEVKALTYAKVLTEVDRFKRKGYIVPEVHDELKRKYEVLYREAVDAGKIAMTGQPNFEENILAIYAIGVEKASLKTLFYYTEVDETVYKKILTDLSNRLEQAENSNERIEIRAADFECDWLDDLSEWSSRLFFGIVSRRPPEVVTLYMYYRARAILARKVLEEFASMKESSHDIYDNQKSFAPMVARYESMERWAREKYVELREKHKVTLDPLVVCFAEAGIYKAEEKILDDLSEKGAISEKVRILLSEELHERTAKIAEAY